MNIQCLDVVLHVPLHLTLDIIASVVDSTGDIIQSLDGVLCILTKRTSLIYSFLEEFSLMSYCPGNGLMSMSFMEEHQTIGAGQLSTLGTECLQFEVGVDSTSEH